MQCSFPTGHAGGHGGPPLRRSTRGAAAIDLRALPRVDRSPNRLGTDRSPTLLPWHLNVKNVAERKETMRGRVAVATQTGEPLDIREYDVRPPREDEVLVRLT